MTHKFFFTAPRDDSIPTEPQAQAGMPGSCCYKKMCIFFWAVLARRQRLRLRTLRVAPPLLLLMLRVFTLVVLGFDLLWLLLLALLPRLVLLRLRADSFPEAYKEHPLAVDQLIDTLQNLRFGQIQGLGYVPMFQRTSLTDQLQELAGVEVNKQIITKAEMNAFFRKVNKG